jgi:hypothetical protein
MTRFRCPILLRLMILATAVFSWGVPTKNSTLGLVVAG